MRIFLIAITLLGAAISAYVTRASKTPARREPSNGVSTLFYGYEHTILAIFVGVQVPLFLILSYYSTLVLLNYVSLFLLSILGYALYAGCQLFLESLKYRIEISQDSLSLFRAFRAPLIMDWDKITKVSYRTPELRIADSDGKEISVRYWIRGFYTLLVTIKTRLPANLTENTLRQLSEKYGLTLS